MIQETKRTFGADGQSAMQRRGRQLGWSLHPTSAKAMAANSSSGGTAVAVRRGIGLVPEPGVTDEAVEHRVGSAWVGGICRGGAHAVSVYLRDSEGMPEANQTLLAKLTQLVSGFRLPWAIVG